MIEDERLAVDERREMGCEVPEMLFDSHRMRDISQTRMTDNYQTLLEETEKIVGHGSTF